MTMSETKHASIGDEITWECPKDKVKKAGVVRKVLENSVIVDMTEFEATVVSHKRYRITKRSGNQSVKPQRKRKPLQVKL